MNLISDAIGAFNQAGMIVCGLIFLAIGGVILADHFYWRAKSARIQGTIKGFRPEHRLPARTFDDENATSPAPVRSWERTAKLVKQNPIKGVLGLLFTVMMSAVPLILVALGIFRIEKFVVLALTGQRADAVVVRNEATNSGKGTTYLAVIDFADPQGRNWEVKDGFGKAGSPLFADGTKLAVFYDRGDPTRYVMDKLWYGPGVGLALVAVGGLILFFFAKIFMAATGLGGARPNYAAEGCYFSVYEYAAPDGHIQLAESDSGSNDVVGKEPGTSVTLLVCPGKPREAREISHRWLALALVFLSAAAALLCVAFGSFHSSLLTFVALGGFILVLASQAVTRASPPGAWQKPDHPDSGLDDDQLRRAKEPFLDHAAWEIRMHWRDATIRKLLPIYLLLATTFIGVGYFSGESMADMVSHGIRSRGSVVRFERQRSSKSVSYHAIARFNDSSGRSFEFSDSVGASIPIGYVGDSVKVIYNASNPTDAIVDRGLWNWTIPVLFAGGGFFTLFLTLKCYFGIRSRAAP